MTKPISQHDVGKAALSFEEICVDEPAMAVRLSVSARTLYEWRKNGLVPAIEIGGRVLYSVSAVRAWAHRKAMAAIDDSNGAAAECYSEMAEPRSSEMKAPAHE